MSRVSILPPNGPKLKYKVRTGFKPCRKEILVNQLARLPATDENGGKWYRYWFHDSPEVRKYFTGYERIKPADCVRSEQFRKQGRRFLMKMHTMVDVSDYFPEFRKHVADLIERHQRRYNFNHMPTYEKMARHWIEFLTESIGMSEVESEQWTMFFKNFFREAYKARNGLIDILK